MNDKKKQKAKIRPYEEKDRDAVRKICCETGFMGDPVDSLFCDREIFSDFFTSYYTDHEPENSIVAEIDGEVVGYVIGCTNYKFYPIKQAFIVIKKVPKIIWRIVSGQYDRQTLKFIKWFLTKANSETPDAPKNAAHFHINIIDRYRQGKVGRQLMFGYLAFLQDKNVPLIYGQIQTYEENGRSHRVFERYGAELYDRREITKFKDFGKTGIYVSTIVVDYRKKRFDEANRIIT